MRYTKELTRFALGMLAGIIIDLLALAERGHKSGLLDKMQQRHNFRHDVINRRSVATTWHSPPVGKGGTHWLSTAQKQKGFWTKAGEVFCDGDEFGSLRRRNQFNPGIADWFSAIT